ncbi:prolyl aminopeptidase [Kineococcus vitellinus]|uniref:prolyl aminopeptidase n=1 Tax=Kineococcus vitellinus TaxID=2696565 RepID=UPI00196B33E7
MAALRTSYPPLEPFAVHRLPVGDGHELHVEQAGNPAGIPVLFLHGGPGGGLRPGDRCFFDPRRYHVVLLDQRGAGRSTPAGGLEANTTAHLVADLERVRAHVGLERWLLFGGSWGSTLALAYAQAHPERVTGFVLRGLHLVRSTELDWFYAGGLAPLQPVEWQRFLAPVPPAERDDVLGAYHRRLTGDDPEEAARWAAPWLRWEFVNSSTAPDPAFLEEVSTSAQAVGAARVLAHYAAHRGFLRDDDELLDGLARVRHLPAVLVQGALDLCCPPVTAWEVAQRWPRARLELVPGAGHSSREPGVLDRLVRATDSFADLLGP